MPPPTVTGITVQTQPPNGNRVLRTGPSAEPGLFHCILHL